MSKVEWQGVHGAYYWLRAKGDSVFWEMKKEDLYIGQCIIREYDYSVWFDVCGDDMAHPSELFDVLEIIEYKGNK